ncbi:MAG: hypothetical protein OXN92_04960 [Gammaproteobacteria bacterium]|nr:hypothetical protein [Gammaproteobacteria bacterium]
MNQELQAEYEAAFPKTATLICQVHDEWIYAEVKTQVFRALYTSEETVATLSALLGGVVSFYVKAALSDSMYLGISRLIDPEKTGRYRNASVNSLPNLIKACMDSKQVDLVKAAAERAVSAGSGIKHYRDKWIAHLDATKDLETVFAKTSLDDVEATLVHIRACVNEVHEHATGARYVDDGGFVGGVRRLSPVSCPPLNLARADRLIAIAHFMRSVLNKDGSRFDAPSRERMELIDRYALWDIADLWTGELPFREMLHLAGGQLTQEILDRRKDMDP